MANESYDQIEWEIHRRRHEANVFNALFYDLEFSFDRNDMLSVISEVAEFFKIDMPSVYDKCQRIAQVVLRKELDSRYELHYNLMQMRKVGLNNRDAYILCIVHELAHQYLSGTHFMLCRNEFWVQELAADYIVGIYSSIFDIATGKYKYVVKNSTQSLTHPCGYHRAEVVEYARNKIADGKFVNLPLALKSFTLFVYKRTKTLNGEFEVFCKTMHEIKKEKSTPKSKAETSIDINVLPNSNLLKQLILKYNGKY